ncbi:tRNA (adenosine(37)-N6)-threonylcarbamoyltransferase complex dimerization subunit type 1 TsaB [Aquibium sp. ELW1220]|uniref:tRNA (adenosine(37)-N6)-threonylcarbamoyltransferase complex dimerization subunit type 1 TsaB n=1 Tax=Aquibium sp. ELW1220 TaxID=2976766 RepID=UPI0025AFEFB0|nr:tRNA (adenosine(37)-N6)-threonylcarbamoyltransferase complex dimerization subunit type 1 TsaB [Aquibium sp. ELW1220]MDN2578621.1 tRNA (adenosine(37)-N6)-threonylcarbamoyltransferase complex dimerization subunit type 1 TsaB [Aquibium sp. ELW1220]
MKILAIDTAAEWCAACLWDAGSGRALGTEARDIGKGHAEALMGVIGVALDRAGASWRDVEAVAVSVGPGSFTGVRIGVATARGLALALKVPATGVGTLAALAFEAAPLARGRPVLAVLDARREEFYAALYGPDGEVHAAPAILDLKAVAALAGLTKPLIVGSGARQAAAAAGLDPDATALANRRTAGIDSFARLAARQGFGGERPRPLYLRGPDARPQEGFALPRSGA